MKVSEFTNFITESAISKIPLPIPVNTFSTSSAEIKSMISASLCKKKVNSCESVNVAICLPRFSNALVAPVCIFSKSLTNASSSGCRSSRILSKLKASNTSEIALFRCGSPSSISHLMYSRTTLFITSSNTPPIKSASLIKLLVKFSKECIKGLNVSSSLHLTMYKVTLRTCVTKARTALAIFMSML